MFDSSNIAIIMSSIISIVSIISAVEIAVYQQRNQKESKAMEMYFTVQAKAYKEFYVAVSNYNDDTNEELYIRLIEASKFAEIVSPKLLADAFDCYSLCITYEHEKAIGNGTIDADYEYIKNKKEYALSIIRISIRNELTRYDSFSRKYLKRIKKLMNKYIYSSSD